MGAAPTNRPSATLVNEVTAQAEALVLEWNRAEDWTVPRIPPSQLRVLSALGRLGPMNLTTLTSHLGAIPSSASRLCDRLQAAGLIERTPSSSSKREVRLKVSRAGQARLDAFARTRCVDFQAVLSSMPPDAQQVLLSGLKEFSAAASHAASQDLERGA